MNKQNGDFTSGDLELLNLAAGMVAVAIKNSYHYTELVVTNKARQRFIKQISDSIGKAPHTV